MSSGSASGKIILFGEHAVVYGQPAIAIPISSLRATVEIIQASVSGITTPDLPVNTDETQHPLMPIVNMIMKAMEINPEPIHITIRSDIPIASGLGSGAAISTAIVRALSQYTGKQFSEAEINEIVYQTEEIHHGTPSGIDNTVIVYERPIWFESGKPIQHIENKSDLTLLIGDTGIPAPTKFSVGDVRKLLEQEPERINKIINSIGQLVQDARTAMCAGDKYELGRLMTRNHTYLQELTVSSPELDLLVTTAIQNGALGAKLSGGGRGGNMIALVNEETLQVVEASLYQVGAVRVIRNHLGAF